MRISKLSLSTLDLFGRVVRMLRIQWREAMRAILIAVTSAILLVLLEGGGKGTRRARGVEDSARARRPRVPATGTVGEDKTGGSRGRGD